jgi:hypothetical protein
MVHCDLRCYDDDDSGFDLYYWQPYWWVWFTDTQPTNRGYSPPPSPDGGFPRRRQQQEESTVSRRTLSVLSPQWTVYVVPFKSSGHYMYRTVVTICTASLTFSSSTFCPHSAFMSFVWIWEQTAIISLYSVNWLVCVTDSVFTARYGLNLTNILNGPLRTFSFFVKPVRTT